MFNTVKAIFIKKANDNSSKTEPKNTLITLKQELKQHAIKIRELKSHRPVNKRGDWKLYDLDYTIFKESRLIRHKHIAYSLIRGRSYGQIEKKCRENNKPDFSLVDTIIKEYTYES